MNPGKFITLEGGEGAGKSTQAKHLSTYLQKQGIETILTREVGGCPSAEDIRNLWLGKGEGYWDGLTEVLLVCAARREHLIKIVWPALERGAWVISDRFMDSTRVYQGVGLGLSIELVDHYYKHIAGKTFEPDLTLLLDLPAEAGIKRAASRGGQEDRYEQKQLDFHQTLRNAYLDLAQKYPERIKIINANRATDEVAASIQKIVAETLPVPV
jgi:dTMP kinase